MRRALLLLALWLCPAAQADVPAGDALLLKTAYVYNFAKFVRWPEGAPASANALSLCVAGTDELADALARLRGRLVRGRPLTVQYLNGGQVPKHCQMLYVAASAQARQAELLQSVRGQPVLTISELPGFARAGGVIELYREGTRLHFIINLGVARAAGLEIQPGLLGLAVVIGQPAVP
ncbi:MAG: YfiR family protein [Gallionellaceae bacterium]|nr:YfiR family protein [Gallionellaceae bacterium]